MGEIHFKPLIEDMTWSYSRIKCFYDCPYRWFLKYIKHVDEKPQFYASYGSFMHKLLERYYKGELTKEEMQIKFLFGFSEEVKGERPQEGTVQKYIRRGSEYLRTFKPFPYNPLGVEKKVVFHIGRHPFVGYIDYLGEKDGELYIVDNKSRDLAPRSGRENPTRKDAELDELLRQLYIYSSAVEQEYGKLPKKLCFNCFKAGTFIEEPFSEAAYQEAIDWAQEGIEEIRDADDFSPCIEYFGCRYICGVNDECCYWQMR